MSVKTKEIQKKVLDHIKYHTGLDLSVDEDFPKLRRRKGKYWFSVQTDDRLSFQAPIILKLERMANESHIVQRIEINGFSSVAIFLEDEPCK
jgi:hypothetical protein